jgi:hypothetical protein
VNFRKLTVGFGSANDSLVMSKSSLPRAMMLFKKRKFVKPLLDKLLINHSDEKTSALSAYRT